VTGNWKLSLEMFCKGQLSWNANFLLGRRVLVFFFARIALVFRAFADFYKMLAFCSLAFGRENQGAVQNIGTNTEVSCCQLATGKVVQRLSSPIY